MGQETARAAVGDDGSVALAVGPPDNGQGHPTMLAQVCAARLGIPVERITLTSGDTGAMADGTGTFGSRTAVVAGNATALAASALRRRILDAASDLLEAAPADLEIGDGAVRVRGAPDHGVTLAEIAQRARAAGNPLAVTETFAPERPTAFAGGAHAAVVAVDIETGEVTVERYAVVHDCGTVINPTIVDGQIHGGVAHGLGNALGEMMVYDDAGRLLTGHFDCYVIPRSEQLPPLLVEHHACPSPNNPEGIKGAGEGGTIGALATIVGAVEDALLPVHPRLNSLPLRYEELARLCGPLRSQSTTEPPS
jgi:carbon-monoxide dehydrogenase large subunit